MAYEVRYTPRANEHLARLAMSEPKAFKKVDALIAELTEHPYTGTGHPEPLRGSSYNRWSRRISKKHRLVYEIYDTEVVVLVIAAYGHYEDK